MTFHAFAMAAVQKYNLIAPHTVHRYSIDELPVILRNGLQAAVEWERRSAAGENKDDTPPGDPGLAGPVPLDICR